MVSSRLDSPRVLVVTADVDPTADHVIRHLLEREVSFVRVDGAHFPAELSLTATFGVTEDGGWSGSMWGLRKIDLTLLRSVYWRRPGDVRPDEALPAEQRQWCARQGRHALWGVLRALPVRLVNDPAAVEKAEFKPVNLAAARGCGLVVPPTLITNRAEDVPLFAARVGGRIVYKPLDGRGLRDERGRPTGVVYVTEVPPGRWEDPGIRATGHCFQQLIDKDHDLRVTVVGRQMFAVEIRSATGRDLLDWRAHYADLDYRVRELPEPEALGVARLLKHLGLHFATLDFVVEKGTGRHLLVDVNPAGQWAWLEYRTGVPISASIADLLTEQP